MPVYVDTARHQYRGMVMCHMLADSVAELLEMADKIGVARRWFQPLSHPHFDLCASKRGRRLVFRAHRDLRGADLGAGNPGLSKGTETGPSGPPIRDRAGHFAGPNKGTAGPQIDEDCGLRTAIPLNRPWFQAGDL